MDTNSFKFKKKFGQNFIKNKTIIKRIVEEANINTDSLIIEVGPGNGALTSELVKKNAKVLAYEVDLELKDILLEKFKNDSNLDIIFDDFLNRNIKADIEKYNYKYLYFVSNVPYYITTPILIKIMDADIPINKIVMMIQKEVGDRFSATPGNKNYGSITVFLNYFYDIRKCFIVNRNEFVPVPNVDSEVICLSKKKEQLKLKDKEAFFKLIKDSFRFKRKTIRNNLKEYDLSKVEKILKKYGYDLNVRSEALKYEIFVDISNNL